MMNSVCACTLIVHRTDIHGLVGFFFYIYHNKTLSNCYDIKNTTKKLILVITQDLHIDSVNTQCFNISKSRLPSGRVYGGVSP